MMALFLVFLDRVFFLDLCESVRFFADRFFLELSASASLSLESGDEEEESSASSAFSESDVESEGVELFFFFFDFTCLEHLALACFFLRSDGLAVSSAAVGLALESAGAFCLSLLAGRVAVPSRSDFAISCASIMCVDKQPGVTIETRRVS